MAAGMVEELDFSDAGRELIYHGNTGRFLRILIKEIRPRPGRGSCMEYTHK